MPAYFIGYVRDLKAYQQYCVQLRGLIAKYHGECVLSPGEIEVDSGDWSDVELIVIRFPDEASIQMYLDDAMYRRLSELGQLGVKGRIVMVGFP